MELHIKNMVCNRCIKSVQQALEKTGVGAESISLGVVKLNEPLSSTQKEQLQTLLSAEGFELLDDQKAKLVDQVKSAIIDLVHYGELDEFKSNLSDYLSSKLHKDYHYLSQLFSSVENTTIEQYFILQKIEKVKEWLVYNEFTLSEMAYRMGYSSVAHLSGQFKKVTGFTPSQFKGLKDHHRNPLDRLGS